MLRVYLAGYIQGEVIDQCLAWRKRIREYYQHWKAKEKFPIVWLDPLSGEEACEISPDGLHSSLPTQAIVHKDYVCVEKADLIVANMDRFGKSRQLTGTICELAWAWQLHKPIIMITNEEQYRDHPFLKYFSSWTVSSVDELLEKKIINEFYRAWHSAQY
jgi:nucleoside 2-deoxyribosyltransferase